MNSPSSTESMTNVGNPAEKPTGKTPGHYVSNEGRSASDIALDAELDQLLLDSPASPAPSSQPDADDLRGEPATTGRRFFERSPATKSSASEAAPVPTTLPYAFPMPAISAEIKAASNEWLVKELDRLCNAWRPHCSPPAPYHEIRDRACHISLELNLRVKRAPRFRHMRKPRPKNKFATYPESDRQLSNDRQVIDLHWLHCRGARMYIAEKKWEGLENPAEFDFGLASAFVASIGYVSKKMAILGLSANVEYELAALQSKALVDRWRIIQKGRDDGGGRQLGVADIRRAFEDAAVNAPGITDKIDDWLILWQCWRLTGNVRELGSLYAFATGGEEPDRSNLKRRHKTMKSYLPASCL